MSDVLKIAVCQYNVFWNDPLANFSTIEELTSELEYELLVLPEMFSSGYMANPIELKDPLAIKVKKWLTNQTSNSLILGSCANKTGNTYYNSLLGYYKQKEVCNYKKAHTFIGGEQNYYSKGKTQSVIDFKDWKISLNICYDLRFPVWCRDQESEIMIFCANWPSTRADHWYTLLKARAIENQCYVIGVNRIGSDNNNWEYMGETVVFDFKGEEILNLKNEETAQTVKVSKEKLLAYRNELPFLKDKDKFTLD